MPELITSTGYKILMDDDEHYKRASKYKWSTHNPGKGKLCVVTYKGHKKHYFSKVVFDIDSKHSIYHKNGNQFDFRKENIIICTKVELGHITKGKYDRTSKYSGVYFVKGKWVAKIVINKNQLHGGYYDIEEEAALTADYLSVQKYGELAIRNFPELIFQELLDEYTKILDKYGYTANERKSRARQGVCTIKTGQKSSKYVGVSKIKCRNKWIAQIHANGIHYRLGRFDNEEDAARAYDKKALELYGKFAKLNFNEQISRGES